ncbi:MAG: hypothetical protein ABIP21_09045 [Acidimicrobiia bacterium]
MSIAIVVGYVLGAAGIVWFAVDSARIPSMIWYWSGFSRLGWWGAILMCLVPFGLPALIVAVVWRFSEARRVLALEFDDARQHGRRAREAQLGRSTESVA